jgi:hypothetical protein
MFGHNDNNQQDNNQPQDYAAAPVYDTPVAASEPVVRDGSLEAPDTVVGGAPNDLIPAAMPDPQSNPIVSGQDEIVTNDYANDSVVTAPAVPPTSADEPAYSTVPASSADSDLLDLKQKALQDLSPLVGQLDQTPEEKFHTTMMMIQANDNKELLSDAYTAAQAITDDKARAQALLDVINEINYFTQAS